MENKEKKSIYNKLFEVKKAWITLVRNQKAFNYKYATLDQIQTKLNPIFEEQKLLIVHFIKDNKVVTQIIDIESEIQMAEWTKAQDKWSEITYYRRYNLLSLLDLEVEDDDWKKAQESKSEEQELPRFSDENLVKLQNIYNSWWKIPTLSEVRKKYRVAKRYIDDLFDLWVQ